MLDVTVASTDRDLTTTSAFRDQIGTTSTANASKQSTLIRAFSRWAETRIGQPLTVQTYRETVAGQGRRNLMLSRTPLRNVLAVYDGTDTGTAVASTNWRVEDAEAGFLSRDEGWAWDAVLQQRSGGYGDAIPLDPMPVAGQERKRWMVDYIAGYTYDGLTTGSANWSTASPLGTTSTGRTLPEDIERAVLLRTQESYDGNDQSGVKSEKLGDLEVEYDTAANLRSGGPDTLTPAELLLEPWRRIA